MQFLKEQQRMQVDFIRVFHDESLIRKRYDKFKDKMVPTEDITWADFVLKNDLFEFDCKFYLQISGTAKFSPTYACIFMD